MARIGTVELVAATLGGELDRIRAMWEAEQPEFAPPPVSKAASPPTISPPANDAVRDLADAIRDLADAIRNRHSCEGATRQ